MERLRKIDANVWSTIVSRGGQPAYCWNCGKLEDAAFMINLDGCRHGSGFVCEDCMIGADDWYGSPSDEHETQELARCYVAAFRHFRKRGAECGPDLPGFRDTFWRHAQAMADNAAHTLDEDWSQIKKDKRTQILAHMGLTWTGDIWITSGMLR
jgi:hypothetical protein